jgi:cysteine-rich repeat protein
MQTIAREIAMARSASTMTDSRFIIGALAALVAGVGMGTASEAAAQAGVCGNGFVEFMEQCDDGNTADGDCCSSFCQFEAAAVVCRPASDVCDAAETCTGASGSCPVDEFLPWLTLCRIAFDACDMNEICSGGDPACPEDAVLNAGATCRPAVAVCDQPEMCDGSSKFCPGDQLKPAGTVCRPLAGDCDLQETCTGASVSCPADEFQPAGNLCRPAITACDLEERCTGTGPGCPPDLNDPSVCEDGDACTHDGCDAGGCSNDPIPLCSPSPFDVALRVACAAAENYAVDTGAGPGPCTGLSFDGVAEVCGTHTLSGADVEVSETETDNGDGTTTVTVDIAASDGSDLVPPGHTCPPSGDPIDTAVVDLAKVDAGGPGVPGDALDPNLGVSPFEILEAKAVVFGTGGGTLLEFDLASAGSTQTELKDRFSVSGADQVTVTALQLRYRIATGEATGGCCLPGDVCIEGVTGVECATQSGVYGGDFSTCPVAPCSAAGGGSDTCVGAAAVADGDTPFDTTGASLDPAAPAPCDLDLVNDRWFEHVATCTGTLSIDTCNGGAGFDTVLEIFEGASCAGLSSVACADDSACGAAGQASVATLATTAGTEYRIRVGDGASGGGAGNLHITCTPVIAGGACCIGDFGCSDVADAAACAGLGGGYQGDGSICGTTFQVQALDAAAVIETCSSSYNTEVRVFEVCGGTLLAENDDCFGVEPGADRDASCYDASQTSGERDSCTCLSTTPGQSYFVQITNFGGTPPPPGSNTSLFVLNEPACRGPIGPTAVPAASRAALALLGASMLGLALVLLGRELAAARGRAGDRRLPGREL